MPEQNNNVDKAVKKMGLRLTIVVLFLIFCFIIYQKNGEQIKNTLVSAYNKTILFLLGKEIELPQTESIFFDKDFYIKKANRNAASPNTR